MANLSADFRQRMREYAHQLGLPAFWRWWTAQPAPLVPAVPRAALKRRLLRPVLAFAQDVAVLWVPRTTNGALSYAASARIPLAGDPAVVQQSGRAVIDALPRVACGAGPAVKVVVALAAGRVLRNCACRRPSSRTSSRRSPTISTATRRSSRTSFTSTPRSSPRYAKRRDTRRLGSGAPQACDRSAPPCGWGATVVAVTGCAGGRRSGDVARLAAQPPAGSRRPAVCLVAPLAALAAARAGRVRPSGRGPVADLAARLRDRICCRPPIRRASRPTPPRARQQLEQMTEDYNYVLGKSTGSRARCRC